ncbi:MAG TPA: DUF3297 domain-containing protein [Shewanella frigidimarina]|nr:DUF3297 domain-containing protein [Shewanella frigidimarina]
MNDTTAKPALPDRLSVNPRSPHHVAAIFEHDIGLLFTGKERADVVLYCSFVTVNNKGQPIGLAFRFLTLRVSLLSSTCRTLQPCLLLSS